MTGLTVKQQPDEIFFVPCQRVGAPEAAKPKAPAEWGGFEAFQPASTQGSERKKCKRMQRRGWWNITE
jgi:hypothetical protein